MRNNVLGVRTALYVIFIRVFGNKLFNTMTNVILPIILTVLYENKDVIDDNIFNISISVTIVSTIMLNILFCIAEFSKEKETKWYTLSKSVCQGIQYINKKTAINIYRLHKHTKHSIENNLFIDGTYLNQISDFQEISFMVCKSIYEIISKVLNCEDCQVTVFQRFTEIDSKEYVKMIAYANKNTSTPSTYNTPYYSKNKKPNTIFKQLFKNSNADEIILLNKKAVNNKFEKLKGSESREKEIQQYIGIPFKGDYEKVIFILQIDVSKKYALGKKEKDIKELSKVFFSPYINVLYNGYENDRVFNMLYSVLANNARRGENGQENNNNI